MVTKLLPPRVGEDLLKRPRLLARFNKAGKRVVFVTAPAGYGKTVAITQYLSDSGQPFVWYQLDSYDNDPLVFLNYFVTGIRRHHPCFAQKTLSQENLGEVAGNPRLAATILVNSLAASVEHELIVILDDYHVIREAKIHRFLEELCFHLPAGLQVVLAGRVQPPLNLSRLHASGDLLSVNAADLRFTLEETRSFLDQKNISLSQEAVASLDEKTGGWPVALRFLSCSTVDALTESSLETEEIYAYLASEVFERQPEEIREFLTATAVLEVMTPNECDLLLERNDSGRLFSFLEKQQLFLIPLAGETKAYRYHQLFREFLLDRLGDRRGGLFRRAGRLAWEAQKTDQAVEYMLEAGIDHQTLAMLKDAGRQALRQGRWLTVARWLTRIPEERITAEPWLCFFQAQVLTYQGQLNEAELWAIQAEKGFDAEQEQSGAIENRILRARILRSQGRYERSIAHLDEAAAVLPPEEIRERFDLPLERALCFFMTGRLQEAEVILKQAIEDAKRANARYILAHLAEGLGNNYVLQGLFPEAMRSFRFAMQVSPNRLLPGYYMQDTIAILYKEWGQLDRALELARHNVMLKEKMGLTETLPSAYGYLGYIYAELGEAALAREYFQRGIAAAARTQSDRYFCTLNRGLLAWVFTMEDRWVEARALAEEALAEAKEQGGLIYPHCQLILGTILAQVEEREQARELLLEAAAKLEEMGVRVQLCYTYKALAWLYWRYGDAEAFQTFARKYLALAARHNYIRNMLPATYHLLRPILEYGLTEGVEVSYIQRVLVQLGEKALDFLEELAGRPGFVRERIIPPLLEIGGEKALEIAQSIRARTSAGGFGKCASRQEESMACPFWIQTFGAFRLFIHGREIAPTNWRIKKARDLLAYLVHRNEPVSTDKILHDLWPDLIPDKAVVAFHSTLYYLRQALRRFTEKDLIVYGAKLYQIRPECFRSDRQQFIAARRRALKEPLTEAVIEELEEAEALYHGDYLADLDYVWVISAQEDLKNMYFEIKQLLATYYLNQQLYPRAITHLRQLTAANPYSEEPLRLLLSALAGIGDYQGVRQQYLAFTKTVSEELGLAPSVELTEFYRKLLAKSVR